MTHTNIRNTNAFDQLANRTPDGGMHDTDRCASEVYSCDTCPRKDVCMAETVDAPTPYTAASVGASIGASATAIALASAAIEHVGRAVSHVPAAHGESIQAKAYDVGAMRRFAAEVADVVGYSSATDIEAATQIYGIYHGYASDPSMG